MVLILSPNTLAVGTEVITQGVAHIGPFINKRPLWKKVILKDGVRWATFHQTKRSKLGLVVKCLAGSTSGILA